MNKLGRFFAALAMVLSVNAIFGADTPTKFLEYVEATGTQYVDTTYTPNGATRIEARYQLTEATGESCYIFGAYGSGSSGRCQFAHANVPLVGFGSKSDNTTLRLSNDTVWHAVVMDKGAFSVDGEALWSADFSGTSRALYLFGCNCNGTAGGLSKVRLASVSISENGVPKRLLVPCVMDDGSVGFWDFVQAKFYGPKGTGVLTAGSEVLLPVTRLDYIRFEKGAYIETGIAPIAHGFEMRFRDEMENCASIVGLSSNSSTYRFYSSGTDFCCNLYSSAASDRCAAFTEYSWCAKDHHVIFNRASDHGLVLDGLDFAMTIGTFSASGTLRIGRNGSTPGFEGRVYSFRLFATADGENVIDAYPALIGGMPCLFDAVGCKAYGAAAGTITAGPVAAGIVDVFCEPAISVPGVDMTQRTGLAGGGDVRIECAEVIRHLSRAAGDEQGLEDLHMERGGTEV